MRRTVTVRGSARAGFSQRPSERPSAATDDGPIDVLAPDGRYLGSCPAGGWRSSPRLPHAAAVPRKRDRGYRPPSGCPRRSSTIFAPEVAAGRHGLTTPCATGSSSTTLPGRDLAPSARCAQASRADANRSTPGPRQRDAEPHLVVGSPLHQQPAKMADRLGNLPKWQTSGDGPAKMAGISPLNPAILAESTFHQAVRPALVHPARARPLPSIPRLPCHTTFANTHPRLRPATGRSAAAPDTKRQDNGQDHGTCGMANCIAGSRGRKWTRSRSPPIPAWRQRTWVADVKTPGTDGSLRPSAC